jgi:hypothetical protein
MQAAEVVTPCLCHSQKKRLGCCASQTKTNTPNECILISGGSALQTALRSCCTQTPLLIQVMGLLHSNITPTHAAAACASPQQLLTKLTRMRLYSTSITEPGAPQQSLCHAHRVDLAVRLGSPLPRRQVLIQASTIQAAQPSVLIGRASRTKH